MSCIECGGNLQPGYAIEHVDRKGYHLTFDAVPALVCTQCHADYLDSHIVRLLEEAMAALDRVSDALSAIDPVMYSTPKGQTTPEAEPHRA
jgi:YgiT-type zinc finger domain-containing protein